MSRSLPAPQRTAAPSEADRLFALVYDALRAQARHLRQRRGSSPTLNTTALVHETYVRLAHADPPPWRDREHFLAVAASAMRHVLVDYARRRHALKRSGRWHRTPLGDAALAGPPTLAVGGWGVEVLDLDAALGRLEALSPRLAAGVELRFFGGLTAAEAAAVLALSPRTVERDWLKAKALLQLFLEEAAV